MRAFRDGMEKWDKLVTARGRWAATRHVLQMLFKRLRAWRVPGDHGAPGRRGPRTDTDGSRKRPPRPADSQKMLRELEVMLPVMQQAVSSKPWEQPLVDVWKQFRGNHGPSGLPWDLNDCHSGRTIFIAGAGPQLNSISASAKKLMTRQVVIGVNRTFLALPLTYFLSSYPWEVALALQGCSATCIQLTKDYAAAPIIPGSLRMQRMHYSPLVGLPDRLAPPVPVLCTLRNVALAASHLAMIMGASRVVFIGVEQTNRAHFWQADSGHQMWLRQRLEEFERSADPRLFEGYDRDKMLRQCFEQLTLDATTLQREPFYEDHSGTFSAYFTLMKAHGIDVVGTQEQSIVCAAGARHVPLEDILAETAIA